MAAEAFPAEIRRYEMEAFAKAHLQRSRALAAVMVVVSVRRLVEMGALLGVGIVVSWGRRSSSPRKLGSEDVVVMGFAGVAWRGVGCCVTEAVAEGLLVKYQKTRKAHYYAAFVEIVGPV